VLVPPGALGEEQKASSLPVKGRTLKWPSSVTHKLSPGNAQQAETNQVDVFAREQHLAHVARSLSLISQLILRFSSAQKGIMSSSLSRNC